MGVRAAVVGGSGYAGGELLRLLDRHPSLEVATVVGASAAGRRVGEVHPGLRSLADRPVLDPSAPELRDAEVVFLAMPPGASAGLIGSLAPESLVVDLGADFRLRDAEDWRRWYRGHPAEHAGTWPYGLPELPGARDTIAGSRRVANPGCYATAVALALVPLLADAVVEPADIVVVAASGTTGAGRVATSHLLASEVMGDVSAYKVGGDHQHLAEMRQTLSAAAGVAVSMSFTPMVVPMPRGILATCTARLRARADTGAVDAAYARYAEEPFVTVLPTGQWPHTAATSGSNSVQLQATLDRDAGRVVVIVALDNLGKGAAGQAVQNANLMLGFAETSGLSVNGLGR
jgi:N-acetyl-gamma-glutamyl-phosphate reductase